MKITIPETVLATELDAEGVLLNLETGEYFGLDEVGLEMWKALNANGDVDAARAVLAGQFDVTDEVLARDLGEFVGKLAERKLLLVSDA